MKDLASLFADYIARVSGGKAHDLNCEWHLDQYPHECTCGLTRPRAPWFQPWREAE